MPAAKKSSAKKPAARKPAARKPPARPGPEEEGKGAYVISQLYYYGAAVIGVAFLLGGAIAGLLGLRTLVLPREFQTVRDGVRGLLNGIAFALPGLALAWWHLREARRRDGGPFTDAFWGSSLYFHLVGLVALGFVLTGTIGVLTALVDLAVPHCFSSETIYGITASAEESVVGLRECYPSASEAARSTLDFALVLAVGAPVFWWHLREGRRLTGSPPAS
ncbi:MAG TPA: DUF5671 domain-containing protein [Actinomycetota bacterium]